jgi:hypothetical protein
VSAPASSPLRWFGALLVALGAVMGFVPLTPLLPLAELDNAWAVAMNQAVVQGLGFGRDLIFTFGPYAGIYTWLFNPATDGMILAGTGLLAAAVTAALLHLAAGRGMVAAILLALFLSQMWLRDAIYFFIPMLFLAVIGRGPESWRSSGGRIALGLLVLAMALLPLVKGTFAAASGLAMALGCGLLLLRGAWRMAVAFGLLFLLAMPGFWLASGQALADLPRFFLSLGEIIRGYTPAMALEGPLWQAAVAAGVAALVLLLNLRGLAQAGLAGAMLGLGAAALLFLSFKAGFVRQDGHIIIAGGTIALVAWVLFLWAGRHRLLSLAGLAVGLVGWAVLDHAAAGLTPNMFAQRLGGSAVQMAEGTATRLRPGRLTQRYEEQIQALRREHPLPPVTGRVDIYSIGQSVLLAHGLPWAPRPILQSYSAYTPALAALNAAHLAGPNAPDTVLLALEPIDNRMAALEDGLSWPLLLTRYEVVSRQGAMLVLRRRAEAGPPPASPIEGVVGEVVAHGMHGFGARVALPADPPALWATIIAKPTLLGRLVSTLLRPPPIDIALSLPGGQTVTRRFIPGMAEAGFLIAPVVQDSRQWLNLAIPGSPIYEDQRPVAFSLSVQPGGEGLWRAEYSLELRRFAAPPQTAAATAAMFRRPAPASPSAEGARCYLDTLNGVPIDHNGAVRLPARSRLNGWGFALLPEETEPSSISLTLTGSDGTVLEVPTEIMSRPDVGVFFGKPALVRIGFQALPDLAGLSGRYRLGLALTTARGRQSCSLSAFPAELTSH